MKLAVQYPAEYLHVVIPSGEDSRLIPARERVLPARPELYRAVKDVDERPGSNKSEEPVGLHFQVDDRFLSGGGEEPNPQARFKNFYFHAGANVSPAPRR